MSLARWIAAALLATSLCGCQSLYKNDPIMGDHPWQPGSGSPLAGSSTEKMR